jgi:hypothetical protein
MKKQKPVIFWHSDPVGPNETLVISGENFADNATVELKRLSDDGKEDDQPPVKISPVQFSRNSLKVVIPQKWKIGIYSCRVTQQEGDSEEVMLNAPDVWWSQGDEGVNRGRQGGWLKLFGKCLAFDKALKLQAKPHKGKAIDLKLTESSCYSVGAEIPENLLPGKYEIVLSNGYGCTESSQLVESFEVLHAFKNEKSIVNVLDLGADPSGKKDSTFAVVQATERLGGLGGGTVYFPRGRYRIDSILRSGNFIKTPLKIPEGITFCGEGMDLVTLWWPDNEEPLPSLIEGANNFAIEDLAIYTQGRHSTVITGESNVSIKRVRIRTNCYYMTNNNGGAHHGRQFDDIKFDNMGAAFHIWGDNLSITDCDIYTSSACFDIKHCHGGYIYGNTVRAKNLHFFSGCSELIFENNEFSGNQLTAGGSNIALHFGASISQHIYYAKNRISHIYGGDHEALTLDGHGTAYFGKVKNVKGSSFELAGKVFPKSESKGYMQDMHGTAIYVVDGYGRGQYRWLKGYKGNSITIDRPWDTDLDDSSVIAIGGFNGRHILFDNTMSDTGTSIQLYPPNCECIVAENKSIRASNINSLSKFGKNKELDFVRVEISWYNQFLDNHIIAGNHWGGGCNEIDRWIGGEGTLNIWGWQVYYYSIKGKDYDEFMTPEVTCAVLNEKNNRARALPLSIFQIIRRHKIDNNSSIRIRGVVSDALIEDCQIAKSAKGVRVDCEVDYEQPEDLGQLFDFDPEKIEEQKIINFLRPSGILIRNNHFEDVTSQYSGTAIKDAIILD